MLTTESMDQQGYHAGTQPSAFVEAENSKFALVSACGARSTADLRIDHAMQAEWVPRNRGSSLIVLQHLVVHYTKAAPMEAIAGARELVACGSFRDSQLTYTFSDELTPDPLAEARAQFTFCGQAKPEFHSCALLVAKDDVATAVQIRGTSPGSVRSEITRMIPTVVAALNRI
ncbi:MULTISPECIES: hypothetical protein [unclassified Crossiella]|uniref:hypothetical protein n=1 Tax=unclassified Crossiella TaxID=2620835 RepID=UPI001FFFDC27|nr:MULTISPECIES: hypothetical protein [unclassified Crossiella]MCK2238987.1 hypothetical protein [Crossiella sp. S99.2]MCK2251444.1 hypothetical protein [Crossiella sp. S99.1]